MVAILPLLSLLLPLAAATPAFLPTPKPALDPTPTITDTLRIHRAFNRLRKHAITPIPTLPPLPPIAPLSIPSSIPSYTPFQAPLRLAHALKLPLHEFITLSGSHTIHVQPTSPDPKSPPHYPVSPPSHENHRGPDLRPPESVFPRFLLEHATAPAASTTSNSPVNTGAVQYPRPHTTRYSYIRRPERTRSRKRKTRNLLPTAGAVPERRPLSERRRKKRPVYSDDEWVP